MNKNVKKAFGIFFLFAILFFVGISILAIWDYVGENSIWKALASIGVLAVAGLLCFGILSVIEIETKNK